MKQYLITLLLAGCFTTGVFAQHVLRGRISDPKGRPLVSASVKVEGLSAEEAGEKADASPSAVKVRAHRAYKIVRGALGGGD